MTRQRRPAGPKPSVAYATQAQALANIESKLQAIASLQKLARPSPQSPADAEILSALPVSLRQFAGWTIASVPSKYSASLPAFGKSAPQTVRGNKELKSKVEAALAITQALGIQARPSQQSRRSKAAQRARESAALAEKLLHLAEINLTQKFRQVADLEARIAQLQGEMRSIELEAKEQLDVLQAELAQIRAENAKLTRTLSKLHPIKAAPKGE